MICCVFFGTIFLTAWHQEGEGGETERVKKKEGIGSVREYDGGHKGGDREAVEGGSGNGERREAL